MKRPIAWFKDDGWAVIAAILWFIGIAIAAHKLI
jgi:hypothetical protein